MDYIRPERIWMKGNPQYSEKWVRQRISEDPMLLGLGELMFKDFERIQRSAGRLDLLLENPDNGERFEVEIMLGSTDETHIIRTIEYWLRERRRYPEYEHTAVLVAEQINNRFFDVISLFNGAIPLIAIQIQAVKIGSTVSLIATTILDRPERGPEGGDDVGREPADEKYWEQPATEMALNVAKMILPLVQNIEGGFALNFTRGYIGISKHQRPYNILWVEPRKRSALVSIKIPQSAEFNERVAGSGLDLDYDTNYGNYRFRLTEQKFSQNTELLDILVRAAVAYREES